MKTEIVVAHLSDLHHPSIEGDRWEQLKTYLKAIQPDLILVTGDLTNHPWPWSQFQVRKKLENVVQACRDARAAAMRPTRDAHTGDNRIAADVKLAVIPGNHDSAFWGNVGSSLLRMLSFDLAFRKYYERFFAIPLGENTVYFFCFDSNPLPIARWAKGKVSQGQLKRFQRTIDELRQANRDAFDHAYKVALLHHHPMPIPYDERLEQYLFLTNAGEFINAMTQNSINLILHGHKHKARISYVSLGTSAAARHLGIVACGTTLKSNEENTCYVIRIFDNMRAEVTKVAAAADVDVFTEDADIYNVPRWDTYIQDRYAAVKQQFGYEIQRVAYKVSVDEDGDGHTEVQLDDLAITNRTRFKEVAPFEQKVSAGTIGSFQYDAPGATGSKLAVEQSNQVIKLRLNLSSTDDNAYSFGFNYWTLNSWALDTEEWDRKYTPEKDRPRHSERFYFSFMRPIQQFRAEVLLPKNCKVNGDPQLIVQALIRDEAGQERLSKPVQGIEHYLDTSLTFSPERNVILLALDKPLYGYNYTIRWYVSAPSQTQANAAYVDETEALIEALWKRKNLNEFTVPLLTVETMIRQRFKVHENERVDVTLAIPVPENQPSASLEFIASNLAFHPILGKRLAIGDGTQGRAFKSRSIQSYHAAYVGNNDPKRNIYMAVGEYAHKILHACPIVHPTATQQVIGILSIGSQGSTSALRLREENRLDMITQMGNIANDYLLTSLEGKCNVPLSRPAS